MSGSLLAARALVAIVDDGRAMTRGCDERPLDALVRRVLQEVPAAGDLFNAPIETEWSAGELGYPDIVGHASDQKVAETGDDPDTPRDPTHLVEIKALDAKYNFSDSGVAALDTYRRNAPQALCFVLMPEARAIDRRLGEKIDQDDIKGRRELIATGREHDTADDWEICTFEGLAAHVRDALPADKRKPRIDDPDVLLIARILRVRGLDE